MKIGLRKILNVLYKILLNHTRKKIKQEQKTTTPENIQASIMPPAIMYPAPESPFTINLNINIDVKDKETMFGVIELVRGLKQEIKTMPSLEVSVDDQIPDN